MIEKVMLGILKTCQDSHRIKFDRIETGSSTIGVPDTFYYSTRPEFHGWAELKHVNTFDTEIIKVPWRPGQLLKGKQYIQAGERVWLIMSADDTGNFIFIHARYWQKEYLHERLIIKKAFLNIPRKELDEQTLMSILQ